MGAMIVLAGSISLSGCATATCSDAAVDRFV